MQIRALNQTLAGLKELGEVYFEIRGLANNTLDTQRQMTIISRDIILEHDQKKLEKLFAAFEKPKAEQLELLEKIEKLGSDDQKQLVKEIRKERDAWQALVAESNKLGIQNKNDEATDILLEKALPHLVRVREYLAKIKEAATASADKVQKDLEQNASETNRNLSLFGLIAVFASVIFSYLIVRSLRSSISKII